MLSRRNFLLGVPSLFGLEALRRVDEHTVVWPHSDPKGAGRLLVHFHGSPRLVLASHRAAGVEASLAIVNRGADLGAYTSAYAGRNAWRTLLRGVASQLPHPVEAVALSGFSAGFGAVLRALQNPTYLDAPLEAVVALDGFHGNRRPDGSFLDATMAPVADWARRAEKGEVFFHLTHSSVPAPDYASTTATADALVERLSRSWQHDEHTLPRPDLPALKRALGPDHLDRFRQTSIGRSRLEGYRGRDARAHAAQLQFASATALPRLAATWPKNE